MIEKLGHDDLHFLNIVPMYIHMKTLDLSFFSVKELLEQEKTQPVLRCSKFSIFVL